MSIERREQLTQQLSDELRGIEDEAIPRIARIFEGALRETVRKILGLLDGIEAQPWYDPETTPGAFLGSTPEGRRAIEPLQKNQAQLILQGQLLQDLRAILDSMEISPRRVERLNRELKELFDRAQDLGTEYAVQLTGADLDPSLAALTPEGELQRLPGQGQGPLLPGQGPAPINMPVYPDREYQGGQRLSRLFDLSGALVAAERDFKSLAENYALERDLATDAHVKAAKAYYAKWWGEWGESVSFETARQMATGPDPRALKKTLQARIPNINEAFKNRAETIARTETLMASGEAQERCYRRLRVGFVQYMATLDDRTCEFCAPRSGCIYWIGGVKTPIHPNCVLPGTKVSPGHVIAATRVRYRGPIVTVTTKGGRRLSCSPNHLVATPAGWVPAGQLKAGGKALSQASGIQPFMADPDLDAAPARIEEVFESLLAASGMAPVSVPVTPMDFHGDGAAGEGNVDVVTADRKLLHWLQSHPLKDGDHFDFQGADAQAAPITGLRPLDLNLLRINAALAGLVGRGDLPGSLLDGHLSPLQELRFLAAAWRDPRFTEPMGDHTSIDPEQIGQALHAGAGLVAVDEILDVEVDPLWHGMVYDLTTASGAYIADGLVTHNCRCGESPITLESLVIQNSLAAGPDETWEAEFRRHAEATMRHWREANGEEAVPKPVGGPGDMRSKASDYPLMERKRLPQSVKKKSLSADDPLNQGARDWPTGDPVWCPRRGWLDPTARAAYEAIVKEVATL